MKRAPGSDPLDPFASAAAPSSKGLLDLPLGDETEVSDFGPAASPSLLPAHPPPRRRWPWLVALLLLLPVAGVAGYLLNLPPAVVVASSALLEFGQLRVDGESGELGLSLSNTGRRALLIGELRLAGEGAAAFSWVEDGCGGQRLPRGARCDLRLRFMPTVRGSARARLVIPSNAANGQLVVPLLGSGAAPRMRLEQARLAFESQPLGTASPSQLAWWVNDGTAPLKLGRARLLGLGAADFFVRGDGCSARALLPGQRCSLEVFFIPTAAGERLAALEIRGDAPELAPTVVLVGGGIERLPLLTVDATALDFGSVLRGSVAERLSLTLTNDGNGPLTLRGLTLDPEETVFTLGEEDCTPSFLEPGTHCSVAVGFEPQQAGSFTARLILDHQLEEAPREILLSGLGTAPGISVAASRLSFGEAALGSLSPSAELRIGNDGSGPLELGKIRVRGGDAQSFLARRDGCSGKTLAAGTSCTIEMGFKSRRDGPHRAVLELVHDAGGDRLRIPLTGIGVSPRLLVTPMLLDFGAVAASRAGSRQLNLSNQGRAGLTVRRLRLSGRDAEFFALGSDGCSGHQIPPGQRCTVELRFAPTSPGSRSATLRVESSMAGEPIEIPLEGHGHKLP